MSPASRSKSKDKKAGKEPPKGSSKPSVHVNATNGASASGYNPFLGTFHTIENSPLPTASSLHANSRFKNIDDTDDHNNNSEYDSVSNNGSWSGESEDPKEKPQPLPRQDSVVPEADNDKREKIRLKNEKKHQRQKERRAQELHERCSGYLMSRKLEALAQQLVVMGFSHERATMALILNEGRVEESVVWLLEGSEEDKQTERSVDSGGSLKIDISDELARISEMEIRYKASKQEIERAVVSCEGDLEKAEEILKVQKDEPPAVPLHREEIFDPPALANSKQPISINQNPVRIQPKSTSLNSTQQKRDEKDFNYTKAPTTVGSPVDPGAKNVQMLKKAPPKPDWTKPQQITIPADKRSLASPLLVSPPPAKAEQPQPRYIAVGNELKNLQLGSVKEPVVVMQRPQSINNSLDTVKPNGFVPSFSISRSHSPNNGVVSSNPLYNHLHYQSHQQQYMSNSSLIDSVGSTRVNNGFYSRGGSPALAAASSLGLFSGSSGLSSPMDWKTGSSILQCDYANVDWSLDRGSLPPRPNGLWAGGSNYSVSNNGHAYDSSSFGYGLGVRSAMRPVLSNGNGAVVQGLQEGLGSTESGGSREWSSPFEEKDIFSLPRQFVSSPSL